MENQVWKDIPCFEGIYQCSNYGNVRSLKFKKVKDLKPLPRANYLRVELNNKPYSIHRLVLMTFVGNNDLKPQVNHINGVKHDNRLENLEWCTQSENICHAIKSGLKKPSIGENNGASKLKEFQIYQIRNSDLSQRKLASIYNVDKSIIGDVKNRQTWKHL